MEISPDAYAEAYDALPEVIRTYLAEGKIGEIVTDIGAKYSFHVDVVGKLARNASYMLMGLVSPAELLGELVLEGIDSGVAKSVLAELNTRIFIPLREEMHKAPSTAPSEEEANRVTEQSSQEALPTRAPEPIAPTPTVQSPTDQETPSSAASTGEPPVQVMPPLLAQQQSAVPEQHYVPAPVELPHARTMAEDMALVSQGLRPGSATPARSFQTASVPVTVSYPRTAALPERAFAPTSTPSPASPPFQGSRPETKQYGGDPYREPIA